MLRLLRSLFLSSAIFVSVIFTATPAWAGYIRGQVFFADGRYADHIVVRLRSDKIDYMDEQTADPNGRFNFDGLNPSTYVLTIEGQGVKTYTKFIDISMSKMSNELITLQPDRPPDAKAVPPEGSGATVNAREADIPPAARKEFDTAQKLLHEKQDAEGGIKHLRKAIELYDKYAEAYMILGLTYLELQKPDDAQPPLEKAIALDSQLPGAYLGLGTLFNQQKKFPDAAKALERGLELTPNVADAQFQLARAYFAMQRWQDAETHARTSASLAPEFAPAHILLGNLALRKGDTATAKAEFSDYLRLDPKGPMAAGAAQVLQKIEQSQKN